MILIGATAIACPLYMWIERETDGAVSWSGLHERVLSLFHSSDGQGGILEKIAYPCILFFALLTPFAATWTIALLPIQLSARRESLRRLASRPGAAAAFSAGNTCILVIAFFFINFIFLGPYKHNSHTTSVSFELEFLMSPIIIGSSVLASWMMQLIGKRWRANSGWVDRLGRALGVFWLIAGAASTGLLILQ